MAIVNTITLTKSNGTFKDMDEVKADIWATINDASYFAYMNDLKIAGTMTVTDNFNTDTQTYTSVRTFNDEVYATWNNDKKPNVATNKAALESAGYTINSNIA
jgi:hypothetical protein